MHDSTVTMTLLCRKQENKASWYPCNAGVLHRRSAQG